jgi:hypothetical protein
MSHDLVTSYGSPDRSRVAVVVLMALLLAPVTLVFLAFHAVNEGNQPSDAQLLENLRTHQAKFDELVRMLDSDCRSVCSAAAGPIELPGLFAMVDSDARSEIYERLLQQISVTDLRYFPDSGNLILRPAGAPTSTEQSSKSYAYLVGSRPEPVVAHHGYNWRGPAIYYLTGDRPITGSWFIHYDTTVALAFSPY